MCLAQAGTVCSLPEALPVQKSASPDCEELNGVEQFCKNCETELHSSEPDVIQDIHPHFISGIFPTADFIT